MQEFIKILVVCKTHDSKQFCPGTTIILIEEILILIMLIILNEEMQDFEKIIKYIQGT